MISSQKAKFIDVPAAWYSNTAVTVPSPQDILNLPLVEPTVFKWAHTNELSSVTYCPTSSTPETKSAENESVIFGCLFNLF